MTIRSANRWDWYEIPLDWVQTLGPVPGLVIRNGRGSRPTTYEIHRTHLPLLAQRGLDVSTVADAPVNAPTVVNGVELRPWQVTGHAWLKPRRGAIVADTMRLGKTAMSLTLHDPSVGPLMILAPLDVRRVWVNWVTRLFPGASIYMIEGLAIDPDRLKAADVIFGHYDIVAAHRLTSLRPGTLIIDEAHLLANIKSRRTEGVRFFTGQAHRVLVLTGTPLWNRTRGLWPLLAMTAPGAWGKPFDFLQRYCSPTLGEYGWQYGALSHDEEWYARQREVVLARSWREVRPDLPPPTYRRVTVGVDRDLAVQLDDAAAELASNVDSTIVAIGRYRSLLGMLKARKAVSLALEYDDRSIIWTWHKTVASEVCRQVVDAGRPAFMISGKEKVEKRLAAIDAWSSTPGAILGVTLAVGQVGLDLSAAPRSFFAEIDWTPVVLSQAAMRAFDPTRGMEATFVAADHPVDNLLVDKVLLKLNRAEVTHMAAADGDFHMGEEAVDGGDGGDLLAHLDEIVAQSAADFARGI